MPRPGHQAASLKRWQRWLPALPVLDWGRRYDLDTLVSDGVAALIVTVMLIPQSLASDNLISDFDHFLTRTLKRHMHQ